MPGCCRLQALTSRSLSPEFLLSNLVPDSGYYYPNRIARIYLQAMEEMIGRNGLNALFNLKDMYQCLGQLPPSNLDKEFDFAMISNLNQGVLDLYGLHGGSGLLTRVGRSTFDRGLKGFGALAGVNDPSFRMLSLSTRIRVFLTAMARIFSHFSDQISRLEMHDDSYLWFIERCPLCWGLQAQRPVCYAALGLLQEGLSWVSGGREHQVAEVECCASGEVSCIFRIEREASS